MKHIPLSEAMDVWPACAQRIKAALEYTMTPDQEFVRRCVAEGKADLWHGAKASAVTCFVDGDKRYLHILALAGENMHEWISDAVERWEEFARAHDCAGLVASGRLGWRDAFREHGFKITHISGMKEV